MSVVVPALLLASLSSGVPAGPPPTSPPTTPPPPPPPPSSTIAHSNALLGLSRITVDVAQLGSQGGGGQAAPVPAAGGGTGAPIECPLVSHAPLGAAAAVQAALDANTSPEAVDSSWQALLEFDARNGSNVAWFRMIDGVPHIRHYYDCDELRGQAEWLPVTLSGGTFVAQPRPEQFLPALYDRVVRQLPTPIPRVGPADWQPERWTYVQISTWFWIDQAPGQWAPVTATASVSGLTVTATATPVALIVHPGDGSPPVRCEGGQPAFRPHHDHNATFRGCGYVYHNSSAMADNGESFPLVVDIVWRGTWTASNGQSGQLGTVSTASETRWLQVAEIQVVIVD